MRSHPGQVSFPGGSLDDTDDGPAACAIREAVEETGLDGAGVEVLGELPALYLPPSGFVVTPVLAWWRTPSPVRRGRPGRGRPRRAGAAAPSCSIPTTGSPHGTRAASSGRRSPSRGLFVWGFTAGLLSRVLALAGLEQPWHTDRVRDLPPEVLAMLR